MLWPMQALDGPSAAAINLSYIHDTHPTHHSVFMLLPCSTKWGTTLGSKALSKHCSTHRWTFMYQTAADLIKRSLNCIEANTLWLHLGMPPFPQMCTNNLRAQTLRWINLFHPQLWITCRQINNESQWSPNSTANFFRKRQGTCPCLESSS